MRKEGRERLRAEISPQNLRRTDREQVIDERAIACSSEKGCRGTHHTH